MADIFHFREVKKSRKEYPCSWCQENIAVRDAYCSYGWRDGNDSGYERLHAECFQAMGQMAIEEGGFFLWMPGDFNRGCCCPAHQCECAGVKHEDVIEVTQ